MEQRTVEYKDYKVVVAEATVRMGMKHTMLVSEGVRRDATEKDEVIDKLIAVYTYSACIAATVEHDGFKEWPVPLEDFLLFPEGFVVDWERAAYELNPHWMPTAPEEEDTEPKNPSAQPGKPTLTKGS